MTSDGVVHVRAPDLPRLTSLRAFAALSVFLFHVDAYIRFRPARLFRDGYAGVGFFFILSGFVLTWSRPRTTKSKTVHAVAFYRRRFARIYPSNLAVLLVVVALGLAERPARPGSVLANAALVQTWFPLLL